MDYTTQYLAEFIAGVRPRDLSLQVVGAVQRCLLDLFGAAAAGYPSPSATALREWACDVFPHGPATVWYDTRHPASIHAAALANSAAASALDIDDGHRAAAGHPGASIIPAALAVAQDVDASGLDLIAAIALGYEVAVRVAAARDPARLDTLSTGRWCAYGAAAAAAHVYGAPIEITAQALSIAGVQSPGLSAAGYSRIMGNHVKEGIPWGTLTGLSALGLARKGFSGPLDILDHAEYYDAKRIREGLGTSFAVEDVYFKPYACCRWMHAALDALEAMLSTRDLPIETIRRIEVYTFERCLRLTNESNPSSHEGAQYSLPFCLATLALEGRNALLPLASDLLGRPEIVALAQRVFLYVDPELDRLFPRQTPARVLVQTESGTREKTCLSPLGDAANPMDPRRREGKFRRLASNHPAPWCDALLAAIAQLPSANVRDLCARLTG